MGQDRQGVGTRTEVQGNTERIGEQGPFAQGRCPDLSVKGDDLAARAFTIEKPEAFHTWRKWVEYLPLQSVALSEAGIDVKSKILEKSEASRAPR
ncbi:MAG: hypothetical protein M2R45_00201 [Verrucomicrobia subdivision 3 bacterium]|nr:hypothetical protein [Limisphaerales bacterium]MCS1412340.1 hypothetical protein [Limisphaerales bacterium]